VSPKVRVEYVGRAPLEGFRRPSAAGDPPDRGFRHRRHPAVRVASAPAVHFPRFHRRQGGSAAKFRCRKAGPTASAIPSADYASINATSEMSAASRSRGRYLENPRAVTYDTEGGARAICRSIRVAPAKC